MSCRVLVCMESARLAQKANRGGSLNGSYLPLGSSHWSPPVSWACWSWRSSRCSSSGDPSPRKPAGLGYCRNENHKPEVIRKISSFLKVLHVGLNKQLAFWVQRLSALLTMQTDFFHLYGIFVDLTAKENRKVYVCLCINTKWAGKCWWLLVAYKWPWF